MGDESGGQVAVGRQVGVGDDMYVGRGVRVDCSGYEVGHVGSGGQISHHSPTGVAVDVAEAVTVGEPKVGVGIGGAGIYGNAPRSAPSSPAPRAGLSAVSQ